tara:strand:+ start:36 stop:314 length:279 start_codon:yes stop_codon:yes gene_type:complete
MKLESYVHYHYVNDDQHIEDESEYSKATQIEVWVQEYNGIDPSVGENFDIPDKYIKHFPPTQEGLKQADEYAWLLCGKYETPEREWFFSGFY